MDLYYFPVFGLPNIQHNPDGANSKESRSDEYSKNEYIRIQSIEIENFKGVTHGIIELEPVKKSINAFDKSNILAVYGQNGSGKTTLIEALYILKQILSGKPLPENATEFISQTSDCAKMKTVFEFYRADSTIEYLTYSFSLKRRDNPTVLRYYREEENTITVNVCDESLTISKRSSDGKLIEKTHKLFDALSNDKVLNASEIQVLVHDVNNNPDKTWIEKSDVLEDKEYAIEKGQSILFTPMELSIVEVTNFTNSDNPYDNEVYAVYPNRYAYLRLLSAFAAHYLFVAGANLFKSFNEEESPIYLREGMVKTYSRKPSYISLPQWLYLGARLNKFNEVLSNIIPGLEIEMDFEIANGDTINISKCEDFRLLDNENPIDYEKLLEHLERSQWDFEDNEEKIEVHFFTSRNGIKVPLSNESEGIKRIIYSLDLFVAAYNNPGITVAIDEFDAGVFEYLLGELLQIFEDTGKGQLILTCHNLRPLEVIDRKHICFTTSNPSNRYIRLKYIGKTNNLRDVYFRQIVMEAQDEIIYSGSKKYKLVEALERCGEINV